MNTNAIIGDDYGTSLPETIVNEDVLMEERKLAKFSKTAEFKRLKDHLESRIAFYQEYLPSGKPILGESVTGEDWRIANAVITEFRAVLGAYEQAKEAVDGPTAR
jgi:hypothetical protein